MHWRPSSSDAPAAGSGVRLGDIGSRARRPGPRVCSMRDVPAAACRLDAALEWAPTGWRAVPVTVVLVVANLVGVGTVALLLIGLSAGAHDPEGGRAVIVLTALGYLAV